ncbi:helix-turn-helix domain-containing protein [Sphingomonas sp. BAUL-RG-20F-R05-02]|uniref:helix-turn-helix domain-containing protein n=1 Tax=Sphingomonas sp. BAUL-RG-20F-R05-02 TaxID=2914830 RepID=UPI0028C4C414|nr:helix-turn-helix domain-containing protein [Sphingomonas sp. BAUL-RG-20F-R05-02]
MARHPTGIGRRGAALCPRDRNNPRFVPGGECGAVQPCGLTGNYFTLPLSRGAMGEALGLAIGTVSRHMSALHNTGLIAVSCGRGLLDRPAPASTGEIGWMSSRELPASSIATAAERSTSRPGRQDGIWQLWCSHGLNRHMRRLCGSRPLLMRQSRQFRTQGAQRPEPASQRQARSGGGLGGG